ncbi:GAF domain-containing protein [Rhodococcus opacus]|uniref:GAF domain-containing protein n=1 Tax=Rhodococcus opacus TaxID=37919 RepID=UPI00105759B3
MTRRGAGKGFSGGHCVFAEPTPPRLTSLRPVRVAGADRDWFSEFTVSAENAGIRACLSVPVLLDDRDPGDGVGAFNVYSYRVEAFDHCEERLLRLLTTAASAAISCSQVHAGLHY